MSSIPATASLSPSPTSSPYPISAKFSPSTGIGEFAGTLIGSFFSVVAAFLGVGYFILRKRRRQRRKSTTGLVSSDKPMLHSDDIKPDRKELQGDEAAPKLPRTLWNDAIAELPANEMPGTELDASNTIQNGRSIQEEARQLR
jgi:LPXTG-motif cell wall-anchored protein